MTTGAHRGSCKWIVDPLYSAESVSPFVPPLPEEEKGVWLYFHYDREAFLLEKMVREKDEAKLKVGYTKFRRTPKEKAFFLTEAVPEEVIRFKATGSCLVTLNGKTLARFPPSNLLHTLVIPQEGPLSILLACGDVKEDIPALFVPDKAERWKISPDGTTREDPVRHCAVAGGVAPHSAKQATKILKAEKTSNNTWDAGRELFAYIHISCGETFVPDLYFGESIPEMENRKAEDEEQTRELIELGPGKWRSKVLLAFRYICIEHAPDAEISLEAEFMPVCYHGAFHVPGREQFDRIWLQSAYTLRLCMKNFLLDGIKRDRLPWAGDLAVSLLGNAFSFGEKEIVKDTLSVLGAVSIRTAHVNTIIDYTLWYLINHELFLLYWGDEAFLFGEYPRIRETLEILLASRDGSGFLKRDPEKDWLFIDWVKGEKFTALQILFFRALRAGAFLADAAGEENFAALLAEEAKKLGETLKRTAFDPETGLFAASPGSKEFTRHPNLLAVDFGLVSGAEAENIAKHLAGKLLPKVGTPYMSVFEVMAVFRGGDAKSAFAKLEEIWGGMLFRGATTFWEGFDPDHRGTEHYAFYDRPFGKSLCHAWGAGPAFLLPQMLFGAEPLSPGWKTFRLAPVKGLTAKAAIPTPCGTIEVECENGEITFLSVPEGCTRV
ncbi:MAG: hypothetical protein J6A21_06000 [Lentisphaeria bacterium]|nr:hypothetical protein [Lentisphaeria bacterium]